MPSQAQKILEAGASEINGLIFCQLVGTDGIAVAEINPKGAPTEAYSAKFALVMTLVAKTLKDVGSGTLEENLVEHSNGWFLTRFVGKGNYYLGIAVAKDAVLGNVRLVGKQISEQLVSVVG
jgi:predicted regulator of Ras-like GTPase activity (Roadblock/LC7/MglB family)